MGACRRDNCHCRNVKTNIEWEQEGINVPSLVILAPFAAIILLNLPLKNLMNKIAFPAALVLALVQAGMVIFLPVSFWSGAHRIDGILKISSQMDSLSLVLLLSIAIVAFTSLLVGGYSIKNETMRFNFINLLLLALTGMNGIVIVTDIFTMYVFLEITALSSFILIAIEKDIAALGGSFKYFILSVTATVLMLSSLAFMFFIAGDTSFQSVRTSIAASPDSTLIIVAVCVFMCGLFIKGGLVPFHGWLPDAYSSAPGAVSVLLAGIITKTTGIYTIARLSGSVFGYTPTVKSLLLFVGALSIVVGAFTALAQRDFKRMLAYSSISQVGYIIISLGTGTALGIAGAVFHLFNHAIFKSQLFVNAAAVERQTGLRDMDKMGGLASRMPVTGGTSVIAFLSTAGIPPLSGFWSKLIIIIALWVSGNTAYAVIALAASLVTLTYFLVMQRRVFFGSVRDELASIREAGPGYTIPAIILTAITIGVGVFFPQILNSFILPVSAIFCN